MVIKDIDKLIRNLEQAELESQDGLPTPEVYGQLLALYLHENDLCHAKYLWKRIPQKVKNANQELAAIWLVGQHMWKRDFTSIYHSLSTTAWSEYIREIMQQVQERIRSRSLEIIAQIYTTIRLEAAATLMGLSSDGCIKLCLEHGWRFDSDTQIVHPVQKHTEDVAHTNTEDQLHKLTDFVSFLEN